VTAPFELFVVKGGDETRKHQANNGFWNDSGCTFAVGGAEYRLDNRVVPQFEFAVGFPTKTRAIK
jgi:hypothetical protein